MKRILWVAALLVSSTAAGCGFDLTDIERRHHPYLSLNLSFHSSGALHAIGRFHPGFDDSGQLRTVTDDSLRMNGVAIAPTEITEGGTRRYEIEGTDPSASALYFKPPAPAGLSEPPPEVVVHRVAPASIDTLIAGRDENLSVALTGVDRIAPAGFTGYWALDIYADACAGPRLISLEGNTVPPLVLEVPVALLPQDLHAGHVLVQGHLEQDASSPGGGYEVLIRSSFVSCIPFRVVP